MTFVIDDNSTGYLELVAHVVDHGRRVSPRGQPTLELQDFSIRLNDPRLSHPVGIGRKYGKAIAAAEAACLVGGVADPDLMISVGSNFARFLDGGNLHGAYGPRLRPQLPRIVEALRADRDTRQAVATIWDPMHDLGGWVPKDLPCTVALGFSIRKDKLYMRTVMRSNDLWWGWAHDAPMFTALQLTVASALGVEPGPYNHHAFSFHLYERDLDAVNELHQPRFVKGPEPEDVTTAPPRVGGAFYSGGGIEQGTERARAVLTGGKVSMPTPAERWYTETLAPHVARVREHRERLVASGA